MILTKDRLSEITNALKRFQLDSNDYVNSYEVTPIIPSLASNELSTFSKPELIESAISQGGTLIEVAADHLMAFQMTIQEPVQTIAPYTSVRSLMEASAIAAWLLDPDIDAKERLQRSFAFRYEGLVQQIKFGQVSNRETDNIKARINAIEGKAVALGYAKLNNKKGKRIGVAQIMPSVTEIIGSMLDEESNYRLFSAIAHGHMWALQQSSFRIIRDSEGAALEKSLELFMIEYLSIHSISSFARPLWFKSRLFGWDLAILADILNSVSDVLGMERLTPRFWLV